MTNDLEIGVVGCGNLTNALLGYKSILGKESLFKNESYKNFVEKIRVTYFALYQ